MRIPQQLFMKPLPGIKHLLASSILLAPVTLAATDAKIEEVIITANKLGSATIQELPNAVKVLSGDQLKDRGAIEFSDFAGAIPSLQFQDLGPGDKEYIIRGTNSSGPSTVGVYFDETPITGSNAQDGGGRNVDIRLVDLERVEVLNGPQGTQYGANSMSGLIRYVPNKPDAEAFSGFIDLDYSSTQEGGDNTLVSGAVNIPVIEDVLAVRLVGWTMDNDGWIDQLRAAGGPREDINDESTDGGRFMLRYTPNENVTFDLSYLTQETEVGGSSRFTPRGVTSFGNADSGFPAVVATRDFENTDITQSPWDEDLDILSATLSYEFEVGTLTGTFSQFERDIDFQFDSSPILFFFGVPIAGVTIQPQSRDVDFAEIRFSSSLDGPFQFLIGASQSEEESSFSSLVVTSDNQGNALPFLAGPANDALSNADGTTFFGRYVDNELDQSAFFGEVSLDINDRLTLIAGARYFESELRSSEGTLHDFGSAATAGPFNNADDDDKITGKFSATFQLTDEVNLYGTIAQGFRVGGLNNSQSLFVDDVPNSYGSDELTSYEIGAKTSSAEGLWNFNVALFHIDWEDIQVETVAGSAFPFTTNAGEAGIDGIEMDFSTTLMEGLDLDLGGSFTDAKLTEDQPIVDSGQDRGLDGDRIPNVPRWQGFAALTYHTDVAWGELKVRLDLTYRGSSDTFFDTNSSNNYELDAYTLANLRTSLDIDGGWSMSLYAKNLTDEEAENDAISSNQDPLAVVGVRPRTVGLSLRKEF